MYCLVSIHQVAIKVDVTGVSQRYDSRVIVISDATSARGVVALVLRKIRLKHEAAENYELVARPNNKDKAATRTSKY